MEYFGEENEIIYQSDKRKVKIVCIKYINILIIIAFINYEYIITQSISFMCTKWS